MNHILKFLAVTAMFLTAAGTAFCDTAQDYVNSGVDKDINQNYDGAIADESKAIELNPNYTEAYLRRAQAEEDKGDHDRAIADYTKYLELASTDNTSLSDRFYGYCSRGDAKKAKGDLDGAIADYTEAIGLEPNNTVAYCNRATLKKSKGDLAGAIADESKAIELDPTNADDYYWRGGAETDKGDYNGAIADFTQCLELDPNAGADANVNVYNSRGIAKDDKGDTDGAIADYTEAIGLDPNNATLYVNRGIAEKNKGDLTAAIADYSKDITLNPNDAGAYVTRGLLRYDTQDFTNALADFRMLNSNDYVSFRIWLIRTRLGEADAATKELLAYLDSRTIGKPDDWPSQIGHFLAGQLAEPDFLAAAKNADPKTESGQLCEAYFYAGSKHLFAGDKTAARDLFTKCVATGQNDLDEYDSAAAELKLLPAETPSPSPSK